MFPSIELRLSRAILPLWKRFVTRAWVTRYLDQHPLHYALLLLPLERGKQQDILRAFTRKPLVSWSILDPTSHALSISPISQSWLLLALPVTFVCGRIASNVCVQISCVCRAIQCRAVSFLVSTSGERGRGRRGGDNVSFARMVTIADRKPGNSGRRNGRGGERKGGDGAAQ